MASPPKWGGRAGIGGLGARPQRPQKQKKGARLHPKIKLIKSNSRLTTFTFFAPTDLDKHVHIGGIDSTNSLHKPLHPLKHCNRSSE